MHEPGDAAQTATGPLPAQACDSHLHIYAVTSAMATDESAVEGAFAACTDEAYARLRSRLGLGRAVVVTPRPHGTDNRTTLGAIEALGVARTRGVGVLHPGVGDAELQRLHAGGLRGLRFTVASSAGAITRLEMIEPLAQRVAPLGWHVQLHMTPAQIVDNAALLMRLPCPIVFDHLARLAPWQPVCEQAWSVLERLAGNGRTWFKLSGHYLGGGVEASMVAARRLAAAWPDRLLWGSDWPHPTEWPDAPPTATTLDALAAWVPDVQARRRILVDNPEHLYGFVPGS